MLVQLVIVVLCLARRAWPRKWHARRSRLLAMVTISACVRVRVLRVQPWTLRCVVFAVILVMCLSPSFAVSPLPRSPALALLDVFVYACCCYGALGA